MRLNEKQIDAIISLIFRKLKEKGLVEFKADEAKVLARAREAIEADIRAEDDLDREVEAILKSHSGQLDSSGADFRKMFQMVKNKLARERGIVL